MQQKETTTRSLKDVELTHFHSGGLACSQEKIYVSGGIPGERVQVVPKRGKGFRSAIAVNILKASPDRTVPFCTHAGICGGCPWQHLKYEAQLEWKKDILRRALDKYGIHIPGISSWAYTVWDPSGNARFYAPVFYHYKGDHHLEEHTGMLRLKYGLSSFYQLNPLQAKLIFSHIAELADDIVSDSSPVFDLYAGVGTIALTLAKKYNRACITGIEGNADAVRDALDNAFLNGLSKTNFITGDILQTFTPSFTAQTGKPSLIVLDPPRSGTLTEIKKTILTAGLTSGLMTCSRIPNTLKLLLSAAKSPDPLQWAV